MSFLIRPISGIKRGYNVVNSLDDKSLIITADSKDYIVKDLEVGREYFISGEIVSNIMEVSDYSKEQVLYISSQIDRAFVNYEDSITRNNRDKLSRKEKEMLKLSIDDFVEIVSSIASNYDFVIFSNVLDNTNDEELVRLFNGERFNLESINKSLKYYPEFVRDDEDFINELDDDEDYIQKGKRI